MCLDIGVGEKETDGDTGREKECGERQRKEKYSPYKQRVVEGKVRETKGMFC